MTTESLVFISYSRNDYYFAESLASHLSRRGIRAWLDVRDLTPGALWERDLEAALDAATCVVLVASPESLRRPNVQKEWRYADQRGKRIVVAQCRGLRLSKELAGREYVDFRGAFAPALSKLISRLARHPEVGPAVERRNRNVIALPLPPWIIAIALILVIPLIRCGVLSSSWTSALQSATVGALIVPYASIVVLLLAWFFALSFLSRRMGMTRLLACLVVIFVACTLTLWLPKIFFSGLFSTMEMYGMNTLPTTIRYWSQFVPDVAIPLSGLAIVLLIRPEDLLRWTPTGTAWDWYRTRSGPIAPVRASGFEQVARYCLSYDPVDQPGANHLRGIFAGMNAQETTDSDSDSTTRVALLTNRTSTEWLTQHIKEHQQSRLLIVVGTSITLRDNLNWLWQRQWIDYRKWNLKDVIRTRGLIQVPERLASPSFPLPVRLAHHLLCALATMPFSLPYSNNSDVSHASRWKDTSDVFFTIGFYFVLIFALVVARRLLRRRISNVGFHRAWIVAWVVVSMMTLTSFYAAVPNAVSRIRLSSEVLFLITFVTLVVRNQDKLAFWFPVGHVAHQSTADELSAHRNWQTLLWLFAYAVFWLVWISALTFFGNAS
jgi:hypothetical protein